MKVISLFCGCGGLDLGFIKAGHEIIWANDNDKDSVETYKKNIDNRVVCGDITKVELKDVPDGDIVIGGFPCQGFSIANLDRHTGDKRNQLYLELLRVIKGKKPKFFVAENVPGILSLAKGKIFNMILDDFSNAGYKVSYSILNAANYGSPQTRKRVVFFGIRKDINFITLFPPEPTHAENPESSLFTKNLKKWVTLGVALKGVSEPNEKSKFSNHVGTKHKVKINGYIGNRATNPNKPSPTIVGRGGGTGGPVIIPHPKLHRRLTPRECARLMDFDDSFIFEGSISSQYRQIGNAVTINMAFNIAKCLPVKFNNKNKLNNRR